MRNTIIAVIILGMFGWAIYDYVSKLDPSDENENFSIENISGTYEEGGQGNLPQGDRNVIGLLPGNIAPNFKLETLDGEFISLSDYKGKRVLLNFWATWCPPCRAEIPDMQKFYEDKDIEVLAVNLIDSRPDEAENVAPFVEEYGMTFPVLLDYDSEVSQGLYNIQPIPTSFLIDSTGRIHNVAYGPLNYDLMVQEFEKMK